VASIGDEIASCAPAFLWKGAPLMGEHPSLDHERVAELLKALRQRTPREITVAMIALGGCFTSEMRHAIELLAAERSVSDEREVS
jgi:hypothetical protein